MNYDSDRQVRAPGKLLGACTAIADRTGLPPTLVRIAAVASLFLISWKLTVVAYCLVALAAHYRRG